MLKVAPKIAVIYYSTYGHVQTLAEAIAAEAKVSGAEVDILQIPEILSDEIRGKMHAAPRASYPDVTPEKLVEYDGFLLGAPTRYGRLPAAVSAFFDATGGLWAQGKLTGKFGGIFTSSASQHGGQESTALTSLPFFAHHGILFVPIGFAAPELTDNSEVVAGSAYGAAAIAGGDGSRQVSEKELKVAKYQAQFFTRIVKQFVAGASALAKTAVTAAEPAAIEQGEPVLGKALPTETAAYEVDTPAAAEPAKVAEPAAVEATPAPAAEPAVEAAPETKETPAAATPAPAAPAKKEPKKKAGLFASCCGGSAKNYD
ncbi:hypothetical protein JCM10213v2_004545 [Rhodosporidiobolus nylandii]